MLFKRSSLAILFLLTIFSCKKNTTDPAEEDKGVNIYAVGFAQDATLPTLRPVYWKNGVKTFLSETDGDAAYVTALNKDVYISGGLNGTASSSGYWKNGSYTAIPVNNTMGGRSAFTDGTDVYIGGSGTKYVKNGVVNTFVTSYSYYTVKDGHFYSLAIDPTTLKYVYYKDDLKVMTLDYSSDLTFAPIGICVYKNDVYIVGNASNFKEGFFGGAYFKNGTLYTSQTDQSLQGLSVTNVIVNETGIHLTASTNSEGKTLGVYWHNSVQTKLAGLPNALSTYPLDIFIYKNDIYLCGSTSRQACYWKNGGLVVLHEALPDLRFTRAKSIIVVPK